MSASDCQRCHLQHHSFIDSAKKTFNLRKYFNWYLHDASCVRLTVTSMKRQSIKLSLETFQSYLITLREKKITCAAS